MNAASSVALPPPSADPVPRAGWPLRLAWRSLRRALYALLSASVGRAMRRPPVLGEPRRILVIRDDRLGDALLATPFLAAVRRAWPRAIVTVLASDANAEVFRRSPDVDRVKVGSSRWRDVLSVARELRGDGGCDAVFDLYSWTELRSSAIAWLTGARHRIGHDTEQRGFLLTHPVPARPGILYEAERSLDLLRALGFEVGDDVTPRFPLREADGVAAWEALRNVGLDSSAGYLVLHPGSGARDPASRRLSPAVLGALARVLAGELALPVLVTGSAPESELAAEVVARAAVPEVISIAGRLALGPLGALLAGARLAIVPDTGVLHLAVAVGARTLAMLGPVGFVNGPARILPPDGRVWSARVDLGCVPADCDIHRCRSIACLRALDAPRLLAQCRAALARAASNEAAWAR